MKIRWFKITKFLDTEFPSPNITSSKNWLVSFPGISRKFWVENIWSKRACAHCHIRLYFSSGNASCSVTEHYKYSHSCKSDGLKSLLSPNFQILKSLNQSQKVKRCHHQRSIVLKLPWSLLLTKQYKFEIYNSINRLLKVFFDQSNNKTGRIVLSYLNSFSNRSWKPSSDLPATDSSISWCWLRHVRLSSASRSPHRAGRERTNMMQRRRACWSSPSPVCMYRM